MPFGIPIPFIISQQMDTIAECNAIRCKPTLRSSISMMKLQISYDRALHSLRTFMGSAKLEDERYGAKSSQL